MQKQYELTPWPRRIRVEQDGTGPRNANIYDADSGEKLTLVLHIEIDAAKGSMLQIIQSKYTPPKGTAELAEGEEHLQGIIVDRMDYPITRLECEAGL